MGFPPGPVPAAAGYREPPRSRTRGRRGPAAEGDRHGERRDQLTLLPRGTGSLRGGLPPTVSPPPAGTLFVLGARGGLGVPPDAGFALFFGRRQPEAHVRVGAEDPQVGCRQGLITRENSRWMLTNLGHAPLRLPGARLLADGGRAALPAGYTPVFVVTQRQEHLLEIRVTTAAAPSRPAARDAGEAGSRGAESYALTARERLVLVCLARRYLREEPNPRPLTWAQVAGELNSLGTGRTWTAKQAAHIVAKVRRQLSARGVRGLLEAEVTPPAGNAINHNLIVELLRGNTLHRTDLRLLGE